MAATWSDVALLAPPLASAPSALQTLILNITEKMVDATVWGDLADTGKTYLAAHLGTLSYPGSAGGAAGPVTSETLGPMSRSYGTSLGVTGELASTAYGQMYLHLQRLVAPVAVVP